MNNVIKYLDIIENTQGTNAKKEVLKKSLQHEEVERFFRKFYDGTVYGASVKVLAKCVAEKFKEKTYEDIGELWSRGENLFEVKSELSEFDFYDIIQNIQTLTGKTLDEYLSFVYTLFNSDIRKLIVRFIVKDLRIGINFTTINNVLQEMGKNKIEKFGVQLCGLVDDVNDWNVFPCYASIKYDGFRCLVEKSGDDIKMTSRQGKDVSYFLPELIEEFKKIKADFILDGEVMAKTFNEIQQRIGKKGQMNEIDDLHYRAFDILFVRYYNDELEIDLSNAEECTRWRTLIDFMNFYTFNEICAVVNTNKLMCNDKLIRLEERNTFNNVDDLKNFYKNACDKKLEGIIIKNFYSVYEINSRDRWFKVKPVFENTFMILNIRFGRGKNKDKISIVTVIDKSKKVVSDVGSGFTDVDRDWMTSQGVHGTNLIGQFVDVKYNEITKSKGSETYSLRHPRFLKFRFDKSEADEIELN